MNRLILIGNGFDLAHGLKTSYKDFITDYFCNAIDVFFENNKYADEFIEIRCKYVTGADDNYKTFEDVKKFITLYSQDDKAAKINFKCGFLKRLFEKTHVENWVNIESEYFHYLNSLLKNGITNHTEKYIHEFNNNFEILKTQLSVYLYKAINNEHKRVSPYRFDRLFCGHYALEPYTENDHEIYNLMILNFNYTWLAEQYMGSITGNFNRRNPKFKNDNLQYNFIHGELNNPENPIIFGFGDEYDAEYQKFEHLQNNELFRHVKSFAYFKTENYQNLIRFMEMDEFEVGIAGHSCGLSDRTLLKHIFEHEKCKHIKIFHHKRKDGTTNYTELTYEIARHFTDKKKMREKIIPFKINDSL